MFELSLDLVLMLVAAAFAAGFVDSIVGGGGLILVPAVAFDRAGNRLGNGAGWYDRLLSGLGRRPIGAGPLLVGIAHDFQLVEHLTAQPWAVPMHPLATPAGVVRPS